MRKGFTGYRVKEVITKCMPNFCPGSKDYFLFLKPIQQNLLIGEHEQCKRKGLEKLVLTVGPRKTLNWEYTGNWRNVQGTTRYIFYLFLKVIFQNRDISKYFHLSSQTWKQAILWTQPCPMTTFPCNISQELERLERQWLLGDPNQGNSFKWKWLCIE